MKNIFKAEQLTNSDISSYMILFIKYIILQSSGEIIINSEQFSPLLIFYFVSLLANNYGGFYVPHKIFLLFYKREELEKYFSMITHAICLFFP